MLLNTYLVHKFNSVKKSSPFQIEICVRFLALSKHKEIYSGIGEFF